MKLEKGMYVRTKKGKIRKIISLSFSSNWKSVFVDTHTWLKEENILKASHRIIDLIQVGDYVNGNLVVEHAHEKGRLFVSTTYIGGHRFTTYEDYSWELTKDREEDIYSVVTKEQFESISYKVGD